MDFESVLRRRLGPLEALIPRRGRHERPNPETLWVRRALSLELSARPRTDDSIRAAAFGAPRGRELALSSEQAGRLVGLGAWTPGSAAGMSSRTLDRWIDRDLLYWAEKDPGVQLPPARLAAGWGGRVARRRAAWPTPAIETALAVSPMPFMPRGGDLDGANMVGLRFATLHRGHEILGVNVFDSARTGAELRRLLPRLNGRWTLRDLEALEGREQVGPMRRLLRTLERLGALEAVPDQDLTGRSVFQTDRSQITWLGHAAVLLQSGGHALITDPLFHPDAEPLLGSHLAPDPRVLPSLDGILITHGDNDHLSANALAQLDPSTPVFVPEVAEPRAPHQVDIQGILRTLGFESVRPLRVWDRVSIGPWVVHALPFAGEDWGLEQAQLTYLIEGPDHTVFLASDSLGPEETYRYLAQYDVDLAFMGVSGAAEPLVGPQGLGYGNFYASWIPEARRNEFVQHTAGPAESAYFTSLFEPRFAFGYAAGGVPWIRTEYADSGSHQAFAQHLEGSATQAVALPVGVPVEPHELRQWVGQGGP